jgi:hypothetical protein
LGVRSFPFALFGFLTHWFSWILGTTKPPFPQNWQDFVGFVIVASPDSSAVCRCLVVRTVQSVV